MLDIFTSPFLALLPAQLHFESLLSSKKIKNKLSVECVIDEDDLTGILKCEVGCYLVFSCEPPIFFAATKTNSMLI